MDELKIGSTTEGGHTVQEILGQSKKVTVFLSEEEQLRWQYDQNNGEIPDDRQDAIMEFDALMMEIKSFIPEDQQEQQLKLLGKSLFLALNTTELPAESDYFKNVRDNNKNYALQACRFDYIFWCMVTAGGLGVILAAAFLVFPDNIKQYLIPGIFGMLGATVSVIQRINSLELDWQASKKMLACEAAGRVIVGSFSGVFFFLACRSDLVLGTIKENAYAINVFAVVAGFSERLIPELMERLESQGSAGSKRNQTEEPAASGQGDAPPNKAGED